MRILRDKEIGLQGGILTMGTFDGVHEGHKYLLRHCRQLAQTHSTFTEVWIYHPHPRAILRKESIPLLTCIEERIERLQQEELEQVRIVQFSDTFALQSAETFIQEWIEAVARPSAIVLGYDHRFGKGREGSVSLLAQRGYKVQTVPALEKAGGIVSSSRLRQLLTEGAVEAASDLLGYPFIIRGEVQRGKQEARQLGVPTANLAWEPEKVRLPAGIYVGKAEIGRVLFPTQPALLYLSPEGILEAHLLGEALYDLYGSFLTVSFLKFLRPHRAFASQKELLEAIEADIQQAWAYFRSEAPSRFDSTEKEDGSRLRS
ncbi:MAG: riboflavin biosynthesis protein RibF [Bacteroidia bacterium]|nr:riboflavin biosynthesis protein RibF [Bacteroidia bacterium]MDW8236693.1 riboflavin biosynthesis protein RibF [Bacteroidia bacterium]